MGHVERPGLVWINASPTEQSDKLLKEVLLETLLATPTIFNVACPGGDDEPRTVARRREAHSGDSCCSALL